MARTSKTRKASRTTGRRTTRRTATRTGSTAARTSTRSTGRGGARGGLLYGKLKNITVHVDDFEAAVDFYRDTLGLKLRTRMDDMQWAEFDAGNGVTLGFHTEPEPGGREVGTPSGLAFQVRNVDQTVTELRSRGAKIVDEPETMPWGSRIATVADPDGNTFVVTQPMR